MQLTNEHFEKYLASFFACNPKNQMKQCYERVYLMCFNLR